MFTQAFYSYARAYRNYSERLGVHISPGRLGLMQPATTTVIETVAAGIDRQEEPATLIFGISGDLDSAVAALLLKEALSLQQTSFKLRSFYLQNEVQPARLRRIGRLIRYLNSDTDFINLQVFDCNTAIQVMSEVLQTPIDISRL